MGTESTTEEGQGTRRVSVGWALRYSAAAIGVGIHDIFFNAVAGPFLRSYGLPVFVVGFLSNERSFVGALLLPIAGAVSDRLRTRIGRRKPFILLIGLVVPGFLVLMTRPDTWMVVLIFLLGPVFLGLAVTAYETLLPDTVAPDQRGRVNGLNRAIRFLAGIGFLVLAATAGRADPGLMFLVVAVSLAVGFTVTLLTIREPPPSAQPEPPMSLNAAAYVRGVIRFREASKYVACYFLYWFGIGGITPFVTLFGIEELKLEESQTYWMLISALVATMVFAAPAGYLGDRFGKKRVTSWGILAFALFILMGSQVQNIEQAIAVLALAGLAQAVPTVLAYPLFTEMVPGRRMGELSGLSTMVWSFAQPLGATLLGAVADQTGTLRSLFIGGALALLCSWAVLQTVHPEREQTQADSEPGSTHFGG